MKKPVPKVLAVLIIVYAALLIPEPEPNVPVDDLGGGSKKAFAWNQDEFWALVPLCLLVRGERTAKQGIEAQ